MGRRVLAATALFVLAACARIEPPPGGPPDKKPPVLVKITPDSFAIIPGFKGDVEFIFDEVISEGGQPSMGYGNSDLERIVLLSPTDKVPIVQWQRTKIGVRPREGWQPNRVYRVQLLPGVSDIRNNKGVGGGIVTFTTGAPVPDYTIRGRAFDWSQGQPLRLGLVTAILEPDSLPYRALTDSSGAYVLGPIPRGTYLVYAGIDLNHNGKLDARDAFDSVRVTPDSGNIPELWAFQHDTTPPHLTPPTVVDSVTLALTFAQKLDPTQTFDTNSVKLVQLPDSNPIRVVAVMTQAAYDSATKIGRAHADSLARQAKPDTLGKAGKPDTTKKAVRPDSLAKPPKPAPPPAVAPDTAKRGGRPGIRPAGADSMLPGAGRRDAITAPKLSRPALSDKIVVVLATPVVQGTHYLAEAFNVKNVSGVMGSSKAGFEVPKRPKASPADSARLLQVKIDTATAHGDSTLADSLRKMMPPIDTTRKAQADSSKKSPAGTPVKQ